MTQGVVESNPAISSIPLSKGLASETFLEARAHTINLQIKYHKTLQ